MTAKNKIIVLRFSAMGDVAMVASVLREFAEQNEKAELIMVSRKLFKPFFDHISPVIFHEIAPKTVHRGIFGLFKLYRELKTYRPLAIADLHDNLRSRILCTFFRLAGIKIRRIDKGRAEKKALTRTENKILKPLTPTVERYATVFRALGFSLKLSHQLQPNPLKLPKQAAIHFKDSHQKKIGISPFAQHHYKVYDLTKMEVVINELSKLGYGLFIFGGGKNEAETAQHWQSQYKNVYNTIGNFNLTEELAIISNLNLMLSMDSSGMHMASLMGVPVISLWGPTHPYAGFLGYGQSENDCMQIAHPNRPNSIYGNKPCLCGVTPCIDLIEPQAIIEKIEQKLIHGKTTFNY
ncbi:glycosyltransferase family 9 protein [Pedobacter sp. ASV28]|uniref:glycosyltransferase family 9 protein n=1 Tax=Pedobacter sp. ASV28 TaxID=2795123 RepID=UPI0018EB77ED|nr:glycosyltransferase family 9 protein [Pedobacter sp. ASV28]